MSGFDSLCCCLCGMLLLPVALGALIEGALLTPPFLDGTSEKGEKDMVVVVKADKAKSEREGGRKEGVERIANVKVFKHA